MNPQQDTGRTDRFEKKTVFRFMRFETENLVEITTYVLLVSLTVVYVLSDHQDYDAAFYTTILSFAGVLVLNLIRPHILRLFPGGKQGYWVFLFASAAFALTGVGLGRTIEVVYILFMIAAQAVMMVEFRPALLFTLTLSVLYLLLVFIVRLDIGWEGALNLLLSMLIGMVFVITLSRMAVLYMDQTERTRALLAELQATNRQLAEAREKEMALAIAQERIHMAREIHDGLGHHLTVLSIQLQAADKLIHIQPEKAAEAIQNSRAEAQSALQEVRRSVAAMRAASVSVQNLPDALAALTRDFSRVSQLDASFEQRGELPSLTEAAAHSLYRAAQEGLTNASKHAQGARSVQVRLTGSSAGVTLHLQDDGAGGDCSGSAGFGLAGIRERVAQLKGSFECGDNPDGGFFLEVFIPAEEERA